MCEFSIWNPEFDFWNNLWSKNAPVIMEPTIYYKCIINNLILYVCNACPLCALCLSIILHNVKFSFFNFHTTLCQHSYHFIFRNWIMCQHQVITIFYFAEITSYRYYEILYEFPNQPSLSKFFTNFPTKQLFCTRPSFFVASFAIQTNSKV